MSHSLVKIWIHGIWSTKERQPLISPLAEKTVYSFIREELKALKCPVRIINGMPDHVHAVFLLNSQVTASDAIKYAKGGSSHSINQIEIITQKFSWQTGFAAYSVSESQIEKVVNYVRRQKFHHRIKTYLEELEELARLHKADEVIEFVDMVAPAVKTGK